MKLIYVAGPYRGESEYDIHANIQQADYYGAMLTAKYPDYFFVIPHKNTAYYGGLQPDEYFLAGTQELLARCDGIYMLPNWETSVGSCQEYDYALKNDIKDYTEELEV